MIRSLITIFLTLCASTVFALSFTGKVVKVSDGDTIQVMRDGKAENVRLSGIDCPEMNQPFGQAAKRFTLDLAAHRMVTVEIETTDRYGRIIGEVTLSDGSSLNRRLVEEGYAWWYHKYSNDKTLHELESKARVKKRGLWSDPHAIAPWDWRRQKKQWL